MSDYRSLSQISQIYQCSEPCSNFPPLIQRQNDYFKNALLLYSSIDDLGAAPTKCPCSKCCPIREYIHHSGTATYTQNTNKSSNLNGQQIHTSEDTDVLDSSSPAEGKTISEAESIVNNAETGKSCIEDANIAGSRQIEDGEDTSHVACFQNTGQGGFLEGSCVHCGLSLCNQLLSKDPWREHARWRPTCPLVTRQKGDEFIHEIIIETQKLKKHLKGLIPFNNKLDNAMLFEAMEKYNQKDIIKAIVERFFANGGNWPTRDQLIFHLDNMRLFKNVHNSPEYCM